MGNFGVKVNRKIISFNGIWIMIGCQFNKVSCYVFLVIASDNLINVLNYYISSNDDVQQIPK